MIVHHANKRSYKSNVPGDVLIKNVDILINYNLGETMMNKEWLTKVGIRTLRTFIQSFLGILVASGTDMIQVDVLTNALVAGLVAGGTALQNGLEEWTPTNKG